MAMPFVREMLCGPGPKRPTHIVVAKAVDGRRKALRHWYIMPTDFEVYAKLGTCPSEGIYPPSIAVGVPTRPALPYINGEARK